MNNKIFLWMFVFVLLLSSVNAIELVATEVNTLEYISQFAEMDNGTEIANLDCSAAECIFRLAPPENETWIMARMLFQLEDNSKISAAGYGGGSALTNGIFIHLHHGGMEYNITNAQPITKNSEWAKFCYDVDISNFGTGNEFLSARWTFAKSGTSILLNGTNNDSISIHLNDDFSGLVSQTFLFQGFRVPQELLEEEESETMSLAIMVGIGIFAAVLLFVAFKLDEEHFILKLLMLFFSIISLMFIPASILTTASATAGNFMKLIYGFFIVFLLYFITYLIYYQFKKSDRFNRILNRGNE